jgi:hypothetical protein
MGHKIYKQRRGSRVIMPLYYTPEPINKLAPVKVKPTKTSQRSMTNDVNNYNNWAKLQAGAQGHTNIDSAEFTRRQTVNARRKQLGKTPKYPMPDTTGKKQVKTTIGRHRGETSGGGNRSGKGAGVKGKKTTGTKATGKKAKGKKVKGTKAKPEGWVNPNRRKKQVVIGSGKMNLTSTGGSAGYKAHQKEMQEKHSSKKILNQEKKSLDMIQGTFQGMLAVLKTDGFKTRITNTNLDTKIRQDKKEGKIRDTPREVKTGAAYNLQSRIGNASGKVTEKSVGVVKTYSFDSLDTSLDLLKSIFDEQVANRGNPKPKITTDSRRGARGGDTQAQPKALGESREDQQVMRS